MRYRSAAPLVVLLALLCGAAAPPDFQGCDCSGDGPDGALPIATGECSADADCADTECAPMQCVAGRCVMGGTVDGDFDGVLASPCGEDCDDTRADVSPNGFEVCDRTDNDCDGTIDEDTSTSASSFSFPVGDPSSSVVAIEGSLFVTEITESALWAVPFELDGTLGSPNEVVRVREGESFVESMAVSSPSGHALFVAVTSGGVARAQRVERSELGTVRRLGEASDLPLENVMEVRAVARGEDSYLIAVTSQAPDSPGAFHVAIFLEPDGEPVEDLTIDEAYFAGLTPSGVAPERDGFIVAAGERTLVRLDANGREIERIELLGTLCRAPLVAVEDRVLVAFTDVRTEVALVEGTALGASTTLAFAATPSTVFLGAAGGRVLAWIDGAIVDTSTGEELLFLGAGASRATFAESEGAIVALGTYGIAVTTAGILVDCGP